MKKITLALAIVMTLAGCQATQRQNATTGETETNSATKGVAAGAVIGAAIGLATGKDAASRKKNALIGLAAGGAVGGGIGYYFDQQEKALREKLKGTGVQVERINENELKLVMENGIGFQSGGYNLDPSIDNTLNGVATILVEYPETTLNVSGYTDSTGSDAKNQVLSEERANSVRQYLINQKVAANRVNARGYGERTPLCTNTTAEGRKCNRRVEITIVPQAK